MKGVPFFSFSNRTIGSVVGQFQMLQINNQLLNVPQVNLDVITIYKQLTMGEKNFLILGLSEPCTFEF